MNYNVEVNDGRVEYLMRSGKDVVRSTTSEQTAMWMLKNGKVSNMYIDGFEEFPIHVGEFYFKGTFEVKAEPKGKREKNIFEE